MRPFAPVRVAELNLEIGAPLPDIEDLAPFQSLFGIARLHGVPVGYVQVPVRAGRCDGRELTRVVLRDHEHAILRHLLADALAAGSVDAIARPDALLDVRHPPSVPRWPSFTVAVCTRDRPADLARCLMSLVELDYPDLEILVVDNAPSTDESEQVVRTRFPRVRYLREARPGISHARNGAIAQTRTDILAFVDDDEVVDRGWARALAAVLADSAAVMLVTGLVAPFELASRAQLDFERHLGWERRFDRRWFRRRTGEALGERLANTGKVGTGANMAFRRSVFETVGFFDPGLGTGTIARGGEDLDMFFRVLRAGHTAVYEPAALVRHRHRADEANVRLQIGGWASGMSAYLVRSIRQYREERRRLAGFTARLLLLYYPRRVAQSLVSHSLRPVLTAAELRGALAGLVRYRQTGGARHGQTSPARGPARRARTISLSLDEPLPAVLPGPDEADRVRVEVHRGRRRIGSVDIWSGGHPVTAMRAADAIAAGLGPLLLEPRASIRQSLRERFGVGSG